MRMYRPALAAFLLASTAWSAAPVPAFAQSADCSVTPAITAEEAPPPLPVYDQPPAPAPNDIWTPGYWSYNNAEYYWVPGTWVAPPQPGLLWTPGFWAFTAGVYAFTRGYWGSHVGFYGGVNYGYGYGGSGFEGGHWDNGQYYYNRAVTNVSNTRITNVYNKTVVNNTTINRTSFNGGPGGLAAQPTAEEKAAANEPHTPPTQAQKEHVRTAAKNEALFAATNKGKPTVAATAQPGQLKGPGVIAAKAPPPPGKEAAVPKPVPAVARPEERPVPEAKAPAARPPEAKPAEKAPAPAAMKKEPAPKPAIKPEAEERKPAAKPPAEKPEAKKPAEKPQEKKPGEENKPG